MRVTPELAEIAHAMRNNVVGQKFIVVLRDMAQKAADDVVASPGDNIRVAQGRAQSLRDLLKFLTTDHRRTTDGNP